MAFSIANKIVTIAKVLSQQEDAQASKNKNFNNVVGFYCPCAGSGTTTIVANIAVMLASQKKNVCVVDLNLMFPEQMRYFFTPKMENNMRSLTEKLLSPSIHMRELVNMTRVPGVSLVSTRFSDAIITLIQVRDEAVIRMFKELQEMFDYVLVDMGGADIAYEATTVAFDSCNYIYTVTAPQLGMINSIVKINDFLIEAKFGTKLSRVLQNQIKDKPFSSKELKSLDLNLIADMPYSEEIRQIGARFQFCCQSTSGSKTLNAYRSVLLILCKNIIQMSDIRNFTVNSDGESNQKADLDSELTAGMDVGSGDTFQENQSTLFEDLTNQPESQRASAQADSLRKGPAPGPGMGGMPGLMPGQPGVYPGGMPGGPGQMPGGMPGMPGGFVRPGQMPGQPGVYPGGMPGGVPGQMPGALNKPGTYPGGMPGQMPGGVPGPMNPGFNRPGQMPNAPQGFNGVQGPAGQQALRPSQDEITPAGLQKTATIPKLPLKKKSVSDIDLDDLA